MASQSWMDYSLQRSARLGLQVLERASRRRPFHMGVNGDCNDAFGNTTQLMAQMSHQCKMLHKFGTGPEPSDAERRHVCRFHSQSVPQIPPPAPPTREIVRPPPVQSGALAAGEQCYIEVCPGTYSITASRPGSQKQTQVITIGAGESVTLKFDL